MLWLHNSHNRSSCQYYYYISLSLCSRSIWFVCCIRHHINVFWLIDWLIVCIWIVALSFYASAIVMWCWRCFYVVSLSVDMCVCTSLCYLVFTIICCISMNWWERLTDPVLRSLIREHLLQWTGWITRRPSVNSPSTWMKRCCCEGNISSLIRTSTHAIQSSSIFSMSRSFDFSFGQVWSLSYVSPSSLVKYLQWATFLHPLTVWVYLQSNFERCILCAVECVVAI